MNDPLNTAPWSSTAISEYLESNATIPWFLKTFESDRSSNASQSSNFRYLGKEMESIALFDSDINTNPIYDAYQRDNGIMNVFFGGKMIMTFTKKNQMSIVEFIEGYKRYKKQTLRKEDSRCFLISMSSLSLISSKRMSSWYQ